MNDTFTVNNRKESQPSGPEGKQWRSSSSGTCSEPQAGGTATDPLGPGCPHWLLLGASLFFFLVWISTLPCRGVLSNEKWQELQVQSSQSPQDLRTPGRHWSLMALSSLLPFPLKETAALSFFHYFHLSVSCDWCIGVGSCGVIDIQLSIG